MTGHLGFASKYFGACGVGEGREGQQWSLERVKGTGFHDVASQPLLYAFEMFYNKICE